MVAGASSLRAIVVPAFHISTRSVFCSSPRVLVSYQVTSCYSSSLLVELSSLNACCWFNSLLSFQVRKQSLFFFPLNPMDSFFSSSLCLILFFPPPSHFLLQSKSVFSQARPHTLSHSHTHAHTLSLPFTHTHALSHLLGSQLRSSVQLLFQCSEEGFAVLHRREMRN